MDGPCTERQPRAKLPLANSDIPNQADVGIQKRLRGRAPAVAGATTRYQVPSLGLVPNCAAVRVSPRRRTHPSRQKCKPNHSKDRGPRSMVEADTPYVEWAPLLHQVQVSKESARHVVCRTTTDNNRTKQRVFTDSPQRVKKMKVANRLPGVESHARASDLRFDLYCRPAAR